MLGCPRERVVLVRHDPSWSDEFRIERRVVLGLLRDAGLEAAVAHIGSTAIQGIKAKPVIDLGIGFSTWANAVEGRRALERSGIDYVPAGNRSGVMFMARGDRQTHHYHLTVLNSPAWTQLIAICNYLQAHLGIATEYESLKEQLAAKYSRSGIAYTQSKRPFLEAVAVRAMHADRMRRYGTAVKRLGPIAPIPSQVVRPDDEETALVKWTPVIEPWSGGSDPDVRTGG